MCKHVAEFPQDKMVGEAVYGGQALKAQCDAIIGIWGHAPGTILITTSIAFNAKTCPPVIWTAKKGLPKRIHCQLCLKS